MPDQNKNPNKSGFLQKLESCRKNVIGLSDAEFCCGSNGARGFLYLKRLTRKRHFSEAGWSQNTDLAMTQNLAGNAQCDIFAPMHYAARCRLLSSILFCLETKTTVVFLRLMIYCIFLIGKEEEYI